MRLQSRRLQWPHRLRLGFFFKHRASFPWARQSPDWRVFRLRRWERMPVSGRLAALVFNGELLGEWGIKAAIAELTSNSQA